MVAQVRVRIPSRRCDEIRVRHGRVGLADRQCQEDTEDREGKKQEPDRREGKQQGGVQLNPATTIPVTPILDECLTVRQITLHVSTTRKSAKPIKMALAMAGSASAMVRA